MTLLRDIVSKKELEKLVEQGIPEDSYLDEPCFKDFAEANKSVINPDPVKNLQICWFAKDGTNIDIGLVGSISAKTSFKLTKTVNNLLFDGEEDTEKKS